MDNTDQELDRWLAAYKVRDADEALLDVIVQQARDTKIVSFPAYSHTQHRWFKNAGFMAATALCGFWLGNTSLETVAAVASADSDAINYDTVILGPQTLQEVML